MTTETPSFFSKTIDIDGRKIGENQPAYFIAEIGANFDHDLDKAKKLALVAKQAGADCAKIQSFITEKIVSRAGFDQMQLKGVHGSWGRSVADVFKDAEFPRAWHKEFFDYCRSIGITPCSAPYDFEAVDLMEECGTTFYKIGSGEITWLDALDNIARKGKPVVLGTGAATMSEIDDAVRVFEKAGNRDLVLLQCITNYPSKVGSANIRAMDTYRQAFGTVVGYSDHSPGDEVVLGSIARGAKLIEKHFTLNKKDKGPDHPHSMEPDEFARMIERARAIESAMGTGRKEVVEEESETVIVQRRGLAVTRDLASGHVLTDVDIVELRPALGIYPKYRAHITGKVISRALKAGDPIRWSDIG